MKEGEVPSAPPLPTAEAKGVQLHCEVDFHSEEWEDGRQLNTCKLQYPGKGFTLGEGGNAAFLQF